MLNGVPYDIRKPQIQTIGYSRRFPAVRTGDLDLDEEDDDEEDSEDEDEDEDQDAQAEEAPPPEEESEKVLYLIFR